jgi:hypothetical protein
VRRVVRPGGWFVGEDSLDDPAFREFHEGDVCVPVDPGTFEARLLAAGFSQAEVERGEDVFRFAAVRPWASRLEEADGCNCPTRTR